MKLAVSDGWNDRPEQAFLDIGNSMYLSYFNLYHNLGYTFLISYLIKELLSNGFPLLATETSKLHFTLCWL